MSKKLFVGGLSWNTTNESLHECFARFGELIEAKVIVDRETGRSRGFGFVSYGDPEAAAAAIAEMDGGQLDGRTLRVNEAEERRQSGGGGGPRSFGGDRGGERSGGAPSRDFARGPSADSGDRGGYQDTARRAPKAKDRRERDRARTQASRGGGGGGSREGGSWNDDWRDD